MVTFVRRPRKLLSLNPKGLQANAARVRVATRIQRIPRATRSKSDRRMMFSGVSGWSVLWASGRASVLG